MDNMLKREAPRHVFTSPISLPKEKKLKLGGETQIVEEEAGSGSMVDDINVVGSLLNFHRCVTFM